MSLSLLYVVWRSGYVATLPGPAKLLSMLFATADLL
jgi:hypothetical protein